MLVKEEPGSRGEHSPSEEPPPLQQFGSPEALQTELERMLAQLSRGGKQEQPVESDVDGEEEDDVDEDDADADEDDAKAMADGSQSPDGQLHPMQSGRAKGGIGNGSLLPNGKKTKGRVKIKMEYIGNKLRRYTTFSKRKTGIMKKANELSTLTGTQVMLLVASETGHVYAFATSKLKPMILAEPGKQLIQNCLNVADDQVVDPAPSRTEFTFEPPGLGFSPMATQHQANPRKRKAGQALGMDLVSAAGGELSTQAGMANGTLLNGTGPMNTAPSVAEDNITNGQSGIEELLFMDGTEDRKRARRQPADDSSHSSPSPAPNEMPQPLKVLKEALRQAAEFKAANEGRLQQQRQNGASTSGQRRPATGQPRKQQNLQQAGQNSSQQLGAVLLPFLLQGLNNSSLCTSSSTTSSPLRTSFPNATSLPFRAASTVGNRRMPRATSGRQQHQNTLPILYQMPQGVVYAMTQDEDGEEDEADAAEQNEASSCMAAVCSSSATPASAASALIGANGSNGSTSGTPFTDADNTTMATGNALQQLLTAGLLPAMNLTAQQLLATAMRGGNSTGGNGHGNEE